MKDVFQRIKELRDSTPQLCHASNILKKYSDGKHQNELALIADKYLAYLETNLDVIGYTEDVIQKRVDLLNEYYNFIHKSGYDNLFSAQGKFRPTILEEFLFLLFKDFIEEYKAGLNRDYLHSGSVKAYSNLYFKARSFSEFVEKPNIAINEKDQDYAIYRSFEISVNGGSKVCLQVPALAIEAKTFIDKTMLDSIIQTAEKVKNGNPYAMFVAVSETYDVSLEVDPAYSRIDQIYILRKTTRKSEWQDVDASVVLRLFNDVMEHLQRPWSDIHAKLTHEGLII